MHFSLHDADPSVPFAGITPRATTRPGDATAQPPLTSGFGAVIEKEQELQAATKAQVGEDHGARAADIDRMLGQQQIRLGANLALLAQRYEMLPNPLRFEPIHTPHRPLTRKRRTAVQKSRGVLHDLVARHVSLRRDLEALIALRADGQRGELILSEVCRNHEEMAAKLSAFLDELLAVRDALPMPIVARHATLPRPIISEGSWENEGGALRPAPPARGSDTPRIP